MNWFKLIQSSLAQIELIQIQLESVETQSSESLFLFVKVLKLTRGRLEGIDNQTIQRCHKSLQSYVCHLELILTYC